MSQIIIIILSFSVDLFRIAFNWRRCCAMNADKIYRLLFFRIFGIDYLLCSIAKTNASAMLSSMRSFRCWCRQRQRKRENTARHSSFDMLVSSFWTLKFKSKCYSKRVVQHQDNDEDKRRSCMTIRGNGDAICVEDAQAARSNEKAARRFRANIDWQRDFPLLSYSSMSIRTFSLSRTHSTHTHRSELARSHCFANSPRQRRCCLPFQLQKMPKCEPQIDAAHCNEPIATVLVS